MGKKYDEMSVVRALSKNPDVKITNRGNLKVVEVVKNSQWCGNGTWGKIDFLVKYCSYTQCFVDINAVIAAKQAEKAAKKQAAREAKAAKAARNKVVINGMELDVKKVMKMKL
jgi:hypothetical protein